VLSADSVGVFSSRKSALAGERNLACLAMVGEARPDFRTISDFRKGHLEACQAVLVQVVRWAGEAGLVQWGHVSTAGTNIQGQASRHKAMSSGYMKKAVERLREASAAWVTQAYQQDAADEAALGRRRGDALPAELARRAGRLATLEAAMRRLEAQAKREAQEERPRRAEAEADRQRRGQTRRGKAPKDVEETPEAKAQSNCTDPALHIRRTNHQGWDYGGNAPASVAGAGQSSVACDGTEAPNDKKQAEPMAQATQETLAQADIERPTDDTGAPQPLPATLESGYDSEAAAQALEALGVDPYMATGRTQPHTPPAEGPESPSTAKERMAAKVQRPEGHELYARRQVIVAPVCGQSKEGRGFRRFLLRGMQQLRGEWRLVCLTHTLLKLWRYGCVPVAASARQEVM